MNVESKICPLTLRVKLSAGVSGSKNPKSKDKSSPSSTVNDVMVDPAEGFKFGALLGGQAITLSCTSLVDIPIKVPFLYSLIINPTTYFPWLLDLYLVNPLDADM